MINLKKIIVFVSTLVIVTFTLVILPVASAETASYPTYTAGEYYSAAHDLYKSNPAAFDNTFKNKTIIVNGEVENIKKLFPSDSYAVSLKGGVTCYFAGNQATAVASLSIGQEISVRGKANASVILNSLAVSMHQCKLNNFDITANQKPEFTLTAQELHNAYKTNEVKATATYKNKIVLVSGIVDSTSMGFSNQPIVYLRTAFRVNNSSVVLTQGSVLCYFSEDEMSAISKLRSGQAVTLMGTVTQGGDMMVAVENCSIK